MNVASVAQIRVLEQRAVSAGIPEYELMLRAGRLAAKIIEQRFPQRKRTVVLCGSGNNGGDGLVTAAHLSGTVIVYALKPLENLSGAAGCAAADLPANVAVFQRETLDESCFEPGDLIVDALLGIGFSGALRENVKSYITAANASGCRCAALDLPSGVDGDTGVVQDIAVNADLTITFGAVKSGLLLADGPKYCGVLETADIQLERIPDAVEAVTFHEAMKMFPRFFSDVHKNQKGELLIVSGSETFSGAAALTARAAVRTGTGIVRLICHSARKSIPDAVIFRELPGNDGVLDSGVFDICRDWVDRSDAVICGPGLGTAPVKVVADALAFEGKVLLDADALNIVSRNPGIWKKRADILITPHWGEAVRLADAFGIRFSGREQLACCLADELSCCVLLKGKNTVVAVPQGKYRYVLPGSSSLATAGSGDVLSGIIGALLAMGSSPADAAVAGAALHGKAGECAGYGMIADDLDHLLYEVFQKYKNGLL